jgi:hypothetical protein
MLKHREMITLEAFAARVRLSVDKVIEQAVKEHGSLENWAKHSRVDAISIKKWLEHTSTAIGASHLIKVDHTIMPIEESTPSWSNEAIDVINNKTTDIEQILIDMGAKPKRGRKSTGKTVVEVMYEKCNYQENMNNDIVNNPDSGTDRTITGITIEGSNSKEGEEQSTTP